MHPLKTVSLLSWLLLLACQVSLLWPGADGIWWWALLLILPLLLPLPGLLREKRYTYKWIGFMAMFYFCVGVSELFASPDLRFYGFGTVIASLLLFLASIYFARYLGLRRPSEN